MLLVLGALHLAAGWLLAQRFPVSERGSERVVSGLLWSYALFFMSPVLFGWVTGWMSWVTVGWSAALGVAVCGLCVVKRDGPIASVVAAPFWHAVLRRFVRVEWALVGMLACYLGWTFYAGAALPIRLWDALVYHCLTPLHWATSGEFGFSRFGHDFDPIIGAGVTYPNAKAVVPWLVLLAGKTFAGTALAQWPYLLLLIASTRAICSRLGIGRLGSWLAIFFLLTTPEVYLQSMEAYSDLAFLAAILAVMWALLIIWEEGPSRARIAATALAFAVMVGTKPTGYIASAVFGTGFLSVMAMKAGHATWLLRMRSSVAMAAIIAAVGFLSAGPWFVAGLREYGNPTYPMEVRLGGVELFKGPWQSSGTAAMTAIQQGASGWRAWWLVLQERERSPLLSAYRSGWGSKTMVLGLAAAPGFLLLTLFRREKRGAWLLFHLLMLGLLLSSPVKLFPRYVLFEVAWFAVGFAMVVGASPIALRAGLAGLFALLAGYDMARLIPSTTYRERPADLALYQLLSGDERAAIWDSFPDEYNGVDYWREAIADEGRVLGVASVQPWQAHPWPKKGTVSRLPTIAESGSEESWRSFIKSRGITELFVEFATPEWAAVRGDDAHFEPLFESVFASSESPMAIHPRALGTLLRVRESAR